MRHPFLDSDVQAFLMRVGVPGRGKTYIREVARELLPSWAANAPKIHQTIPIGHWLRGPLRELLEHYTREQALGDVFDVRALATLKEAHQSGLADHGWRLWALTAFAAWREHVLGALNTKAPLHSVGATASPRVAEPAE